MRVIFACSLLFLVPAALLAEVGFIHENGFSFPAFPPSASRVKFVDFDQDGLREFLAVCDTLVVLYEINSGSAIFVHHTDSLRPHTQAIVDDVNGDAFADLVLVVAIPDTHSYLPTPTDWRIICYDGATEFVDSLEALLHSNAAHSALEWSANLDLLTTVDLDNDGDKELLYSYSYASYSLWNSSEGGHTVAYDRFPDSLRWALPYLTTQIMPMKRDDTGVRILCREYLSYTMELGPDTRDTDALLKRMDSDGSLILAVTQCLDSTCSGGGFNECYYNSSLAGDIIEANAGDELITVRRRDFYCPWEPNSQTWESLVLFRLNPTDSLGEMEELWSMPLPSDRYGLTNFIVHPNLPGYFFGFAGDTLFMFRGENGSIRSSIAAPAGQRYWETNWPDSIPRLVVINGHEVDIYSLDISTDSENDVDPILPHSFTLGRPYPNPFNAEVTIPITLPSRTQLRVEIFNLLGQPVTLITDRLESAGELKLTWDASGQASGVYLVRAVSGNTTESTKLLLLK
jgi:hypothetical protein